MLRIYLIMSIAAILLMPEARAQVDSEDKAYQTQVPEGMELKRLGRKASVTAVLPQGTEIRREGDLRIIEGSGEYVSRRFVEYDARLDKMAADIGSIQNDIRKIRDTISAMQKSELVSKEAEANVE